jgi:signal transduction histidine kinase
MSSRGPRPWNTALAAAAATALIVEGLVRAGAGLAPGDYVLALAAAAPLAWAPRAPLATLVGVGFGGILCDTAFDAGWAASGMVIAALYTVALMGGLKRSLIVGTLTAMVVIAGILLIDGTVDLQAVALRIPLAFLSLAIGDTIRSRRALVVAGRERAERDARDREEGHQRRIADERLRIASELHDTLAHSLVEINVQAGVAAHLDGSSNSSVALLDIKRASASALRDLRGTLSLLRNENDAAPTAPALDLDAIPRLAERARSSGLDTEVDVQLEGCSVPSAIGVAAYRIVDETLTNVLRHADASSAHVRLRTTYGTLDIEITADGEADAAAVNEGLGLRNMSERAAALGGRLAVEPGGGGGWSVHAVLPLHSDRR